jgi:sugar phosphate permease
MNIQPQPKPVKPYSLRFHYGYLIAVVSVITVVGALGFARFAYTMIYSNMMEGLGVGNTEMGLLATSNFFGYLIFSLAGGILASRFGPRAVIAVSLAVAGLAMIFTGLAGGIGVAIAMRFITGLGSGGSNVPVMGLLSSWFAPHRRGMAAGLAVGGSGLAIFIAGFLVPAVNHTFLAEGWRYNWYILGGLVMGIGIIAWLFLRNNPEEMDLKPIGDSEPGLELSKKANQGKPATLQWNLVYQSKGLWHLAALYFLFGFSYIIFVNLFSAYLVREMGLPEGTAGYMWSMSGLLAIFSGFIWGNVSDYFGRKVGLAAVYALQGVCFGIFAFGAGSTAFWTAAILFGLTSFSIPAIMAAASGDYVGSKLAPAAYGMITIMFGLGQIIGPTLAGYLADVYGTYTISFQVASGAALLGAIGSLLLKSPEKPKYY